MSRGFFVCPGRDAFHRVPFVKEEVWDEVELVLTILVGTRPYLYDAAVISAAVASVAM